MSNRFRAIVIAADLDDAADELLQSIPDLVASVFGDPPATTDAAQVESAPSSVASEPVDISPFADKNGAQNPRYAIGEPWRGEDGKGYATDGGSLAVLYDGSHLDRPAGRVPDVSHLVEIIDRRVGDSEASYSLPLDEAHPQKLADRSIPKRHVWAIEKLPNVAILHDEIRRRVWTHRTKVLCRERDNMTDKQLLARIRRMRSRSEWSVADLAVAIGVTRGRIRRVLDGEIVEQRRREQTAVETNARQLMQQRGYR